MAPLLLTGCGKSEDDVLKQAATRMERRDLAGAEVDLKSVLQRNPRSPEARRALGELYLTRGDAAAAVAEFERALEADAKPDIVLPKLARAMLANNQARSLIDQHGDKKLADPLAQAEFDAQIATANFLLGNVPRATTLLDASLKEHPDHPALLLTRARIALRQGDRAGAMGIVDALLARHPNSAEAWTFKGDLLWNDMAKADEALAAYDKAIALAPFELHPLGARVAVNLRRQDIPAAEAAFKALSERAPKTVMTVYYDAQVAFAKRDFNRARQSYQALLAVVPNSPQYLVGASETELNLGDLAQAENYAQKALNVAPDNAIARRLMAQVLLRQGQAQRALDLLADQVAQPQASPDLLALAAEAEAQLGRGKEAQALYARMAQLNPADVRLRTMAATASLARGERNKALTELAAISKEDRGIGADLQIVNAHVAAGEVDQALEAVKGVAAKMPGKAYPEMLRSQVLLRKGDRAGARAALDAALKNEGDFLPALLALVALDTAENKLDDARARMEAFQKANPRNAKVLMARADFEQRAGATPAQVSGLLEQAVKLAPDDAGVRRAQVGALMASGDQRGALTAAQNAVAAMPRDADLLEQLARVQLANGDRDQALASWGKLAALKPKSDAADLGLAEVYFQERKFKEGLRYVDQVLVRDPRNAQALNMALLAHLGMRQFPEALERARAMQVARPDEGAGWIMEAEVEGAQARWTDAEKALRTAMAKPRPGEAALKLYATLQRQGRDADAEALAQQWLKSHPRDVGFQFFLGNAARDSGQPAVAEKRFREVLAAQPNHPYALNNLAMLIVADRPREAEKLIDQALLIAPNNAALLDTKAVVQSKLGQHKQALATQQRAITLLPRAAGLRVQLARLYVAAGEPAEARSTLQGMLDGDTRLTPEERGLVSKELDALKR